MYLTLLPPPYQKVKDAVVSVEKQVKDFIQVRWTLYPVCPHVADVVLPLRSAHVFNRTSSCLSSMKPSWPTCRA